MLNLNGITNVLQNPSSISFNPTTSGKRNKVSIASQQALLNSSFSLENPSKIEKRITKNEKPLNERLEKAVAKFAYWMNAYNHRGETRPDVLLLRWLFAGRGAKLIHNYEEFVKLATRLNSGEYKISEVPSISQFEKAIRTYRKYEKENRKLV